MCLVIERLNGLQAWRRWIWDPNNKIHENTRQDQLNLLRAIAFSESWMGMKLAEGDLKRIGNAKVIQYYCANYEGHSEVTAMDQVFLLTPSRLAFNRIFIG